jgi:hypothetical protein
MLVPWASIRRAHLRAAAGAVDSKGLPVLVMVTSAPVQDRAAARDVRFRLRLLHPQLTLAWGEERGWF